MGPLLIDKDSYFNDRSHLLEEENNFVKIGNSIVGLASGSLDAATQRAEKAWDSPYDFVNYWTWGLPDIISGTYEGMEERADKLDDSPYDFFNWISMGFLDTVVGTVAPDDLYSEEHLANSAALAFFILGGRTAKVKNKSSKLETSPNVNNRTIGEVVEGTGNIISEADNLKLSQWKYRPSDELYIQYKHVFDNPKYYDQSTGSINWPINDGFEGVAKETTLKPGARIDRYGFESGTFVSPEGIPYEMRSLAPDTKSKPYHVYEVLKPIDGLEGKIAPWFDEVGGGVQYKLTKSIQDLLDEGYLREVFD